MAASPIPPPAPSTSTVSPACAGARSRSAYRQVLVALGERCRPRRVEHIGQHRHCRSRRRHLGWRSHPIRPRRGLVAPPRPRRHPHPPRDTVPGGLCPRHERHRRLDLVLPATNKRVHVVHARRLHVDHDLPRPRLGIRAFLDAAAATGDRARCRRRHARAVTLPSGRWTPTAPSGRCAPTSSTLLPAARGGRRHPVRPARHRAASPGRALSRSSPPRSWCSSPATHRSACAASMPSATAPTSSSSPSTPTTAGAASAAPCCGPACDWARRPRLPRAHPRDLPRRGLERPVLRVRGLRRGRVRPTTGWSPTGCRPKSR